MSAAAPRLVELHCAKCSSHVHLPLEVVRRFPARWNGVRGWETEVGCPICRHERGGYYPLLRRDRPVVYTGGWVRTLAAGWEAALAASDIPQGYSESDMVAEAIEDICRAVEALDQEGWFLWDATDAVREAVDALASEDAGVDEIATARADLSALLQRLAAMDVVVIDSGDTVHPMPGDADLVAWALSNGYSARQCRRRDSTTGQLPEHWRWSITTARGGAVPLATICGPWSGLPPLTWSLRQRLQAARGDYTS